MRVLLAKFVRPIFLYLFITTIFICGVAVFGVKYYETFSELKSANSLREYQDSFFQQRIARLGNEKISLENALISTQNNIVSLEEKVRELGGTVSIYEKLKSLDPQLLQKYSKVYFLNENYKPLWLANIDPKYLFEKKKVVQIHGNVSIPLMNLINSSNSQNLGLLISSGYRSFGDQAKLKSSYRVTYGTTKANSFSADQGYSEHQLGTTVDFTTSKTGDLSLKFEATPEFKWLTNNAHLYGFVLSYPKNNKYYIYEPWHWRYVGKDLATKLFNEKKYLYDLDQREIDGYLISIFN